MSVHPAVEELCVYLKQTGTGESKLATLRELGTMDKPFDPEAFLVKAAKKLTRGTMTKIHEYISRAKQAPEAVANPEPIEAPVAVVPLAIVPPVAEAATEVATEEKDEVEEPTDQLTKEEEENKVEETNADVHRQHGRKRR